MVKNIFISSYSVYQNSSNSAKYKYWIFLHSQMSKQFYIKQFSLV